MVARACRRPVRVKDLVGEDDASLEVGIARSNVKSEQSTVLAVIQHGILGSQLLKIDGVNGRCLVSQGGTARVGNAKATTAGDLDKPTLF